MTTQLKDIYWLAGLIEGDGCFSANGPGRCYPVLKISMGDLDVMQRSAFILKANVRSYNDRRPDRKCYHEVALTGRRAAAWMMTLYSLMGARRQMQIRNSFSRMENSTMSSVAIAEPQSPNSEALSANLFAFPECTFTPVSLEIPHGMKFERWEQLGTALRSAGKGVQFWIGDWIRYGEHEYGEKYSQAIEATGKQLSTLQGYVYVAEHIDPCRRRQLDSVDYSTHAEVASLPAAEQERILAEAEDSPDRMTVKQVRREVHKVKRRSGKTKSEIELLHTPEVQAYLQRYIETLQQLEEEVPLTAKFLRNMAQSHTAQAHWQKTRSIDDDCQIIRQAVTKSGGQIAEDDLYQWLMDHGYFMSDPEFEERLEYMNRDDVRLALVTSAGPEGKQENRRGKLSSIIAVPWAKIWDQGSKRIKEDDEDDF